jgi:hypothetical protein
MLVLYCTAISFFAKGYLFSFFWNESTNNCLIVHILTNTCFLKIKKHPYKCNTNNVPFKVLPWMVILHMQKIVFGAVLKPVLSWRIGFSFLYPLNRDSRTLTSFEEIASYNMLVIDILVLKYNKKYYIESVI